MKYYVCSPMGRTASKRVVFGLRSSLQSRERMFISHEGLYNEKDPLLQGFKLYDIEENSETYTDEQAIQIMNEWETPIALHSHNLNLLPTDPSGWKFILSTRKRKIDTVLSLMLAMKSNSFWHEDPVSDKFKRFRADPKTIEKYMEEYIQRESTFIHNVIALTGKPPATIYLEDSWQMIQQKTGRQFSPEAEHQDTLTISSLKPVDYITNYNAIQKRYDDKLDYYKNQFVTEVF